MSAVTPAPQGPPPPTPSSFDSEFKLESTGRRFLRRLREEPLVPLGGLLTCAALFSATRAIRRGDHATANVMFRRRIQAQGATIACLLVGSLYWSKDRERRKEWERLERERLAVEKRERWVRELEARDEEDRRGRERLRAMVAGGKKRSEEDRVGGVGAAKGGEGENGTKLKRLRGMIENEMNSMAREGGKEDE